MSKEGLDLIDYLIDYLGEQVGVRSEEHLNGITLPAHAIDWLSRNSINNPVVQRSHGEDYDKWQLLKALLPHAKKIRVTPDPWPKPKRKRHAIAEQQRPPANVNMSLFPGLKVLWLDRVPLEWISHLRVVKDKLTVLRITQSCIYNLRTSPLLQHMEQHNGDNTTNFFQSLTHVKLAHCCLGENSGLRPTRAGAPAPLSTLSRSVRSLSLEHNDIETEATALAGLSDLTDLVKLDLSHNRISALPRIHTWLSDLTTLNLSHNCLQSVAGIDHLFTLRTLLLDHNDLVDLEQTANALAGLHHLTELHLDGNPATTNDSDYRIAVFNSFRERRFSTLDISSIEHLTLRAVQSLLPVLDTKPASPAELRALRQRSFVRLAVNGAARQGRISIARRRRGRCRRHTPKLKTGGERHRQRQHRVRLRQEILFSPTDVIASMTNPVDAIPAELLRCSEQEQQRIDGGTRTAGMAEHDTALWEQLAENIGDSYRGAIECTVVWPGENKGSGSSLAVPLSTIEDEEEKSRFELSTVARSDQETINNEELTAASISTLKEDTEMKLSGTPTATTTDTRQSERPAGTGATVSVSSIPGSCATPARSIMSSPGSTAQSPLPLSLRISSENIWHDDLASVPSSLGGGFRDGSPLSRKEAFHAAEQHSTYDGPHVHKRLIVRKHLELYFHTFVFAPLQTIPDDEEEPWHEILRNHPKLQLWPVDRKNRETAFQNSKSFSLRTDDESESFRYVWKEKIVACGKNALRRLTPHRKTRYGFHGEQLFTVEDSTTMRPDVTIEARDVICCCSDRCFYIIADHDTVTLASRGKKSFPRAIPKSGTFKDAKWPHAMACHQLDALEQITIGFGFQRMTLHFSCANTFGGFTYILLTSSKIETVSLFKRFQELSGSAREVVLGSPGPQSSLCVENDDPIVLDAIGNAIAPDALGVILRYQIVQQRWRHGDRGSVRRICVLTDSKLFLLDEDYVGDGSSDNFEGQIGRSQNRLVDSAELGQVTEVQAADADPKAITIVISVSAFARSHNWRLLCRTGDSAEKLVDDVRKAIDSYKAMG